MKGAAAIGNNPPVLQLSVPPSRPFKGKRPHSLDLQTHPRSLGCLQHHLSYVTRFPSCPLPRPPWRSASPFCCKDTIPPPRHREMVRLAKRHCHHPDPKMVVPPSLAAGSLHSLGKGIGGRGVSLQLCFFF